MTIKPASITKDQEAAQIVAAGLAADAAAGVDVLGTLAKGGSLAVGRLLGMLAKAQKAPDAPASKPDQSPDEPAEGEGEEEEEGGEGEGEGGEGEGGGDDERADDGAGYEDMNLAVYQGPGAEVLVDVTEYLEHNARRFEASVAHVDALAKAMQATHNLMKASFERLETMEKAAHANGTLLAATAAAVVEGQQLLAKGVSAQFERLLQVPEPSTDFRRPSAHAHKADLEDAAFLGGSHDRERELLSKAMRLSVITHAQAELFRSTRKFSPNVAQSAETRKRVESI